MITVTSIATLHESILNIPSTVTDDWWFKATLADAYFGFLTFYCWVLYKETSVLSRIVWFILIMALGNMAMSAYLLIQLFKLPASAGPKELLLRHSD
jgi:predicted permease